MGVFDLGRSAQGRSLVDVEATFKDFWEGTDLVGRTESLRDSKGKVFWPSGTGEPFDWSFWICIPMPRSSFGSKLKDFNIRHAQSPMVFLSLVARPEGSDKGPCLLKRSHAP